ncbi:hypothetical protein [Labedella endophytica]|uniref:PH domain-containing protein n=1 Tax=Labedella endophytica TaxID=1523160 RepID=A0A433JMT7_9MICO|nr:hypothetical protein [Labedella endophytica]RUQ96937.1 hypothetical protein ELQ94_16960 [Labedella endophytica]
MTDAPTSFPPLIVGTDAAAVRRVFRGPLILTSVMACLVAAVAVAVGVGVASSSDDVVLGFVLGLVVLLWSAYFVWMLVYLVRAVERRASIGRALTLDHDGMEWAIPEGSIVVPWPLITAVSSRTRSRYRILTYRLADGVTAETPGVRSDLSRKHVRLITRRGLQIGSAGIDVSIDTIVAATAAFTQGRLVPR